MDAVPGAPPAGYAAPPRFLSRRAAVFLTAVAALLAAAVVGAVVVSRSYGPLEPATSFSPRPVGETEYRVVHSLEPAGRTIYAVDGNEAGSFGFVFDVANSGRLALTLDSPPADDPWMVAGQAELLVSAGPPWSDEAETFVPADGVTIEPGDVRNLYVRFRWSDHCARGEAGVGGPTGARVRYSAYRVFRREQTIELPAGFVIVCGPLPRPDGMYVERGYTGPRAP